MSTRTPRLDKVSDFPVCDGSPCCGGSLLEVNVHDKGPGIHSLCDMKVVAQINEHV